MLRGKKLFIFLLISVFTSNVFGAGYTVKKANSVSSTASADNKKSVSGALGSNLVQTALTLGVGAASVAKQTQNSIEECSPSSSEIRFVNDMIKEIAKIGVTKSDFNSKFSSLVSRECADEAEYINVEQTILNGAASNSNTISALGRCYPVFKPSEDKVADYLESFYKVSEVTLDNPNGTRKNKVTVSNVYDVWSIIMDSYFDDKDLLNTEIDMAVKLTEKSSKCSAVKLSQKKKELWSNFALGVVGSIGKTTGTADTGNTMQMIQSLTQGSAGGSKLNNIMNIGSSFLGKIGQ